MIFFLLFFPAVIYCQVSVSGVVKDAETGAALPYAAVVIDAGNGITTNNEGFFAFRDIADGRHSIIVRMLGYKPWKDEFEISGRDSVSFRVLLTPLEIEKEGVVITATRTENFINDIPTRVNLVTPRIIRAAPALTVDDYLANIPGVNVSRPFGILSAKSSVTMRGLSGTEQARVLVMIDGIPVNKSDGGSVNWNLPDPDMIERIEVVKGPVSSVYGCDAMGGAINIITRKPSEGLHATVKAGYGTYNTVTGRLNLADKKELGRGRSFYWLANGFYRTSDGYITQSEADRAASSFIVPSYLKEYSGEIKAGFSFSKNETIELDVIYYDDHRGAGETIYQPGGNSTDHDTYQTRIRYSKTKGRFDYNTSLFWNLERYKKVTEYLKGTNYTYYDVVSKRPDFGILSSVTYSSGSWHKLSGGIDIRQGSVDARDKYYTSTDIVYNKGKMFNAGLFLQDEMTLPGERFKVVAGIRYDLAEFYDGAFTIATPSAETSFMSSLQNPAFRSVFSNAVTPRLSVNYSLTKDSRIYLSAGRGFRPSVLDDLCRSGRIKGGFKLANPGTRPEYLTSFEAGGDIRLAGNIRTSLSVYYSTGTDFMYYVNSGDSINMGFGDKPVFIRTNIPRVDIYGAEAEVNYRLADNLIFNAAYSFSHSEIIRYRKLDSNDVADLTGKHLTDVPSNTFSLTGVWQNCIADLSMAYRWQDRMWVNDQNLFDSTVGSDRYPSYYTIDMKLSKQIKAVRIDLGIQNLTDRKFYDIRGAVCPGRFVSIDAAVSF